MPLVPYTIMVRGIERRKIFDGDADRDHFLHQMGEILLDTETTCFAWSLMPNHFHLLLRTGNIPVSTVMRRLLTGYAIWFNRSRRRFGHLFQNRFKSILDEVVKSRKTVIPVKAGIQNLLK
jgi:REP element-mobilizing transposase RayT